jgi:hypothetical protein
MVVVIKNLKKAFLTNQSRPNETQMLMLISRKETLFIQQTHLGIKQDQIKTYETNK